MKIIDEYSRFQLIGFSLADKWGSATFANHTP